MKYIYLHGFASSPDSVKARFYQTQFSHKGLKLIVPDLNLVDFSQLSVVKIMERVVQEFDDGDVALIGSSFGGLISLMLAERYPQVKRLVLMAPALGINQLWGSIIGAENLKIWEANGKFPIYHYGYKCSQDLHYAFIKELSAFADNAFNVALPTIIFHGIHDETIPVQFSRDHSINREYVELEELESNHSLEDQLNYMWQKSAVFLELN